jgi:MOSC domain-containing protein YiiM
MSRCADEEKRTMTGWAGSIVALHRCSAAGEPMQDSPRLRLVAGKGIEGDRYLLGTGSYSNRPEEGRQITLFEIETLEALRRDYNIALTPAEHRRNVTVAGVPLNHLVGQRLRVGDALLEGTRLSTPCRYLEEITGRSVFKPLVHRAGLNCRILEGGMIHVGAAVIPA